MTYLIAAGHNNIAGYGTPSPQPKCLGMFPGRRAQTWDGLVYEDGYKSAVWQFGYMTIAQFKAFQDSVGLGPGTPSARVTVRTTDNYQRDFNDYNATIILPDIPSSTKYDMTVWQSVEFKLVRMDEI
jgi:hypothetical protein